MASGESFTGFVKKENGRFGFIAQDNGGDDMFVMPGECIGFGRALPPVGTRVMYTVGRDPKKGEPRAEDVVPEDEGGDVMQELLGLFDPEQAEKEPQLPEGTLSGTVKRSCGNFGFILQDNGEADMFLMPVQCKAFGGRLPPVGARVVYTVGTDAKTGKPMADDVKPEEALLGGNPALPRWRREMRPHRPVDGEPALPADDLQSILEVGTCTGIVKHNSGKFGFILQDGSEADMFFMPIQCEAFGGVCPPVGTRVIYEVTEDAKTRRPRAENVRPEDPDTPPSARVGSARATSLGGETERGSYRGAIKVNSGSFGFILQDSGEADMFVMPAQCADFGGRLPPVGTRVTYDVGLDPKTEKPRAENLQLEAEVAGSPSMQPPTMQSPSMPAFPFSAPSAPSTDEYSGAIKQSGGRFGFILPDDGQADMFVMPLQCTGFGGECPPVGTRVMYKVGMDPKSGRPRAEDVRPEGGSGCNGDGGCGGNYGPGPSKFKGFGSHPYGRPMDFL